MTKILLLISVLLTNVSAFSINAPTPISPANLALGQSSTVTLDWTSVSGNAGYIYEIDTVPTFDSPNLLGGNSAVNASEIDVPNLYFGTTYYWRAATKDISDTSGWTATRSFTTLDAVLLLSPSDGALNQVISPTLDWSAVTGNWGYVIEYDTVASFDSPMLFNGYSNYNTSEYTATDLLFGTTYYWRAAVKNSVDTSLWSTEWSFTTVDSVYLQSPANGAINQPVSLTLDWSSALGNEGYLYEVDVVPSFNSPSLISGSSAVNSSEIDVNGLLNGTQYYWRAAIKNSIDTSMWTSAWSFKTAYLLTNSPTLISPTNGTNGVSQNGQNFTWSTVVGATSYEVQYSMDPSFMTNVNSAIETGSSSIFNGLNLNSTYYWRVRAQDVSGNSPWSVSWSFDTGNCFTNNTVELDVCNSYIFDGNLLTSSGSYQAVFTGYNGCDSIVDLDLVINTVDVLTTVTSEPLITANAVSATFNWLDCNDGFTLIQNETGQSFEAIENGNYAVEVSQNGCVDTSECVLITTIGLTEKKVDEMIVIYPNPNKGNMSVAFSENLSGTITISSVQGRLVENMKFEDLNVIELYLNEVSGIYLLELNTLNSRQVYRIMIE